MTKTIIWLMISICCVLSISSSAMAGQYLKIEKIDAATEFPRVKVFLTVSGIDCSFGVLNENDLVINEDGLRIEDPLIVTKAMDSENFLYLVFSVDSSKSISKKFLKNIKLSAKEIAGSIGSKDKIAVYQFNDSVVLLNSFTQSTDEIIKNIDGIERHGKKTLLYTSIYDSIELFDKVKQINKKVIVFTDGKDEGSSVGEEDIIQFARNAMIPIYFICCKDSKNVRSMARISQQTGGKLIYSNSNDVSGMYRTVMSVMKNRYTAVYPTKLNMDGMNHRIEVRLKHKDLRDRDSEVFFLEKKQSGGAIVSNTTIIAINILLLIILFAIVAFFIYREKHLLKKKTEIEQGYPLSRSYGYEERATHSTNEEDASSEKNYSSAWLFQKNGSEIGKKYPIQYLSLIHI